MKIIVNGAGGRMGKILTGVIEKTEDLEAAALVSPEFHADPVERCFSSLDEAEAYGCTGGADVVIDFSHHDATDALCSFAERTGIPTVICTTGQTDEEMERIRKCAETVPVFKSENMSLGIALQGYLAKIVTRAFPDADIEIVEKHHNRKIDVPSGTALNLARKIRSVREDSMFNVGRHENGRRTPQEIGIHSLRMGNEVGTHEIFFETDSQVITITHETKDRALFADGAVSAARFLIGKPAGLYSMDDIFEE
jgi:4-hydroxy-tetrahydrodipicolinate reductase